MVPNVHGDLHGDLPVHYTEGQGKVLADDSVTVLLKVILPPVRFGHFITDDVPVVVKNG